MRSAAKPVDKEGYPAPEWRPWFAWHYVYVYAEIVPGEIIRWRVWWEWVERKVTYHGGYDGTQREATYRLLHNDKDFQL